MFVWKLGDRISGIVSNSQKEKRNRDVRIACDKSSLNDMQSINVLDVHFGRNDFVSRLALKKYPERQECSYLHRQPRSAAFTGNAPRHQKEKRM